MHVLTLKHVHVASTQGHFRKEAKRNELAFLLSNDDKIKCFTADRKTVFILLFSRSGMCVQFRTAFGVLPYHIPVVGIHSGRTMFYTWVGNRNNIVSPLYSWRQNKPQTVPTEKKKTARGSGMVKTSQNFSFLSHVAC